jgi:hypothetical protein
VAEHREPKSRLRDEDVARNRHEQGAGRIWAALVVTRNDDAFTPVLHDDLGRAEDVSGRDVPDADVADPDSFIVGDRLAALRAAAHFHDSECLGGGEHRAVTTAGVIAVAVCHPGPILRLRWIDPRARRAHVDPFGMRFDPGTQSRHWSYIG